MRPALPARILQPGGLGLLSPRTAHRLERVVALFRQLDGMEVIEVAKSQSGRNLKLGRDATERHKEQLAWMAEVRALLAEAKSLLDQGEGWSKLYSDRAFRLQCPVTAEQLRHHENIARRYLQCLTSGYLSGSNPSGTNDSTAPTEYLAWARLHVSDPENALLGMQPDPAIVRLVPDWEHRAKVASSATPVQIGDLALLRRVKQSDWIYVRVASLSENITFEKLVSLRLAPGPGIVGVHTSANEVEVMQTNYVVPLPTLARECIVGGRPERIVWQWSDELKGRVKERVLEKIRSLMAEVGINETELKELPKQKATIFESPMLRRARRKLLPILGTFASAGHRDELKAYIDREYAQFFSRDFSDPQAFFLPRIEASIEDLQLARQQFYTLAEDLVQQYLAYCEDGLEQLDKRQLLNGSVKSEMTNWWLKLIASRIETFVAQRGYDATVIPFDYLDSPPRDLALVKKNLEIIETVMRELNDKSRSFPIHKAIDELSQEILPKVEAFISSSVMTLTEILWNDGGSTFVSSNSNGIPSSLRERPMSLIEEHSHDSVSALRARLCERQADLDAETCMLVSGQLLDIEYLQEMLMRSWRPRPGRLAIEGVVPLEGIAVGRIIRFENELRTVLERWGRADVAKEASGNIVGATEQTSQLRHLLADSALAAAFKQYATQRKAMDMVACWEAIEAFKAIAKPEERVKEARALYGRFVDPTSASSLSVDEDLATALQAKLSNPDAAASRNTFDDLQHFAWQMLEYGICLKFTLTDEYKTLQARKNPAVTSPERERRPSFSSSARGLLTRLKSPERARQSPLGRRVVSPERVDGGRDRGITEPARPSTGATTATRVPSPPALLQASTRRLLVESNAPQKDLSLATERQSPAISSPPRSTPPLSDSSSPLSATARDRPPSPRPLAGAAQQGVVPPPPPPSSSSLSNVTSSVAAPVYFTAAAVMARAPSPQPKSNPSANPNLNPANARAPVPLHAPPQPMPMQGQPARLSDVPLSSSGLLMSLMDEKVIVNTDTQAVLQPLSIKNSAQRTEYTALPYTLPLDDRSSTASTPNHDQMSPRLGALVLTHSKAEQSRQLSPRPRTPPTSLASSATRSPSPRRPPVKLDLARSLSPRPAPPPTELPNRSGRPGAASPPRERPDGDSANLSPKGSPKEVKDERSDSGSSGGNNNPGSTKSSPEPVVDVKPQFVPKFSVSYSSLQKNKPLPPIPPGNRTTPLK